MIIIEEEKKLYIINMVVIRNNAIIFDISNKYSIFLKNYFNEEEIIIIDGKKISLFDYIINIINSNCIKVKDNI